MSTSTDLETYPQVVVNEVLDALKAWGCTSLGKLDFLEGCVQAALIQLDRGNVAGNALAKAILEAAQEELCLMD